MSPQRPASRLPSPTGPRGAPGPGAAPAAPAGGRRGFTLIELLIVIVVIGLLIAVIGLVGTRVMHSQKVRATESIMQGVTMALEQFQTENPLAAIYDTRARRTFGALPPYELERDPGTHVGAILEPAGADPGSLRDRLVRDLKIPSGGGVVLAPSDQNDDIRALYAYLRIYAAGTLAQVREDSLRPLSATVEYIDRGSGPAGRVEVLGIHDAWGVPLSYFLYVKLEYGVLPSGQLGWRVTDRIPVLWSRGVEREAAGTATPDSWIFSVPFPTPPAAQGDANFRVNGVLGSTTPRDNGWARARAANEQPGPEVFGYVP